MLKNMPCYTEITSCKKGKRCSDLANKKIPLLCVENDTFDKSLTNLEAAILSNFPHSFSCKKCNGPMTVNRIFGNHIFIEVSDIMLPIKV